MKKVKLKEVKDLEGDIYHHDQASVSPCLDHSNSLFKLLMTAKLRVNSEVFTMASKVLLTAFPL